MLEDKITEIANDYDQDTQRPIAERLGKLAFAGFIGFLASIVAESIWDAVRDRKHSEIEETE